MHCAVATTRCGWPFEQWQAKNIDRMALQLEYLHAQAWKSKSTVTFMAVPMLDSKIRCMCIISTHFLNGVFFEIIGVGSARKVVTALLWKSWKLPKLPQYRLWLTSAFVEIKIKVLITIIWKTSFVEAVAEHEVALLTLPWMEKADKPWSHRGVVRTGESLSLVLSHASLDPVEIRMKSKITRYPRSGASSITVRGQS